MFILLTIEQYIRFLWQYKFCLKNVMLCVLQVTESLTARHDILNQKQGHLIFFRNSKNQS